MIASYIVWVFSSKYFHISVEIPLMYQSQLSHMEISKRWKYINGGYYFALVCFNGLNAPFEYNLLECETKTLQD